MTLSETGEELEGEELSCAISITYGSPAASRRRPAREPLWCSTTPTVTTGMRRRTEQAFRLRHCLAFVQILPRLVLSDEELPSERHLTSNQTLTRVSVTTIWPTIVTAVDDHGSFPTSFKWRHAEAVWGRN